MRNKTYSSIIVLLIFCVGIVSCGNVKQDTSPPQVSPTPPPTLPESEKVKTLIPISQYPLPGEAIDKKFILFFDRNVYFPPEIPINDYVKTEPPIRGFAQCVENKVVFSLLEDIPKGIEEITFCVHPELQSEDKVKIDNQYLCHKVPVKGLEVEGGNFEEVNENDFVFAVKFSHPIVPEEMRPFLSLTDQNNSEVEYDIQAGSSQTNTIRLFVKWTGNETYKLLVKPGYMDTEKKYKGQGAYFEFPNSEPLAVVSCEQKSSTQILIVFSRPVSGFTLYKCLNINTKNFAITPADWGEVQEVAINVPESMRKRTNEKISKAWIINFGAYDNNPLFLSLRKNTWSYDYALLRDEYRWQPRNIEGTFKIDYAYWENKGLDGVACVLNMPSINTKTALDYLEIEPPVTNLSIQEDRWNYVKIVGDWKSNMNYTLKWKAGLAWGGDGDYSGTNYLILSRDYIYSLPQVPEFKTLDFDKKDKFYIIPYHEKNFIRVGARNISQGYIHIYKVLPENLSIWSEKVDENVVPFEINERTTQYLKTIPIEFPNSVDKASYVDVDLTEVLSNFPRGMFTLYLSSVNEPDKFQPSWVGTESNNYVNAGYDWGDEYGDSEEVESHPIREKIVKSSIRYVLWTRLGIVSQWDNTSLVAFVHDLIDLSPQVGARVSVYSIKNQKVAEAVTDNTGVAKMFIEQKNMGVPVLLTVETNNDFSFVMLNSKPLPSLKDLEKYDKYAKDAYDAFIYADRNLYRPGEQIHSRWIVRTNYGAEPVTAPLELRFVNPQNKVVLRKVVNLSEWGTGGEDIATETTYLTGAYTLGLYVPGSEKICGSIPIYIEDFVPDRIKVELSTAQDFWTVGEEQQINVSSQYYVGPPAGDLPCKAKLIITPTELEHENWKGYYFGNDEVLKTIVMDLGSQTTDKDGKVSFTFNFDPPEPINKPVEIAVVGEVSEAGGRAVSSVKKVKGYPENILCGLGVEKVGDKLQVAVALVDKNFAPAPDEEVNVFLERKEWRYVNRYYRGAGGRTTPQWELFYTLLEQQKVTTQGGRAVVQFNIPPYYSTYRIRAQRSNGKTFSGITFYCVPNQLMKLKAGPPELVKIQVEDKKWPVGEVVPVNIEVPFDGKAVAVIQGDRVWDMQVIDVVSGKGSFSFEVKEEYFPNVWIGVTALHVPTKGETVDPYSTFSFAKIEVDKPERKLNIAISQIPSEIKPQSTIELGLQTTDSKGNPVPSEVTVAVVDEGIHSILNYTLPQPYEWFARPRFSPIYRVHYYDHVAYDYDPLSPSGDMIARQLSAGKPEIGETWIKPLALWSGTVRTDEKGSASVSFTFPEFNGTVRIVAVGVNKELVGSTENKMLVRRPCVIQTHLPRFLRPQDRAIIFGRGLNSQSNPLDVNLSLVSNDAISVEPNQIQWEALPNQLSLSPDIVLNCLTGAKNAQLTWKYSIKDKSGNTVDEFTEETSIPIRLPSLYEQRVISRALLPSEIVHLDTSEFIDNPLLETEIQIGGSPFLRLMPSLRWLWNYEYCCCEQKISRLYSLYLFRNELKESIGSGKTESDIDQLLLNMIDSLFAHQQANGGFSLWPYSTSTDLKASLHTAFLLTLINRDKALPLPEKSYQRMLAFLQDVSEKGETGKEFKAFATLILALNGDPSACERVMDMVKLDYPRNLKVLLLLTADLCGMPKEELKQYIQTLQWETSEEDQVYNWGYGTPEIRNSALKLISKIIADEPIESILEAQKPLIEYVSKNLNYTTYNLSMVLLALNMSFKKMNVQPFYSMAEIRINDEVQNIKGTEVFQQKGKGPVKIDLLNKGTNTLFYVWTIRGIPSNPPKDAKQSNMIITRKIYNAHSREIATTSFSQGEVYIIEYFVRTYKRPESLILTQLLPAGFEIENPRLKQEQLKEEFQDIYRDTYIVIPEHVEVRDDKLIVALPSPPPSSYKNTYTYICAIRAITKGTFEFPGAYIEDMYNPEISARLATEQITIQ